MRFSVCVSRCAIAVALGAVLSPFWSAPPANGATDDEEDAKQPGLVAQYFVNGSQPTFARPEMAPMYLLAAGQAPDPRLPVKGWSVKWTGVIKVMKAGKYRFSAIHSGPVEIVLTADRKLALSEIDARTAATPSDAIELPFGLTPFEMTFDCSTEAPALKVFWQSEDLPREQISALSFGHTAQTLKALGQSAIDDSYFQGRLSVEEHSCAACHRSTDASGALRALPTRRGPALTDAASRLKPAWIVRWLADPQSMRPDAVMPRLFSADKSGELERFAVALYLTNPTKAHPAMSAAEAKIEPAKPADEPAIAGGERLFNQTGCLVCHGATREAAARVLLRNLQQKTTTGLVAAYLQDPLAHDPAGRMPSLNLNKAEADHLALYLMHRDEKSPTSLALPSEPPEDNQVLTRLLDMGRTLFEKKNCAACHDFIPDGASHPLPAKFAEHDLAAIARKPTTGCLMPADTKSDGATPLFGAELDRAAAASFLKQSLSAPGTTAPSETARLALARFNCLGCHQRDGQGGLSPQVIQKLAENQAPETAELVSPPQLTAVSEKLLAGYMKAVLQDGRRSRPWMTLRMPQFPKDQMANLPACLSALDGNSLQTEPHRAAGLSPADDKQLAEAGRQLVGANGFGCTKCHDMLGTVSGGTRGPDLSLVAERVNHSWFDRWMTDPQRIQPGTRMPTVFLGGASPYKDVLGGDPAKQRLAIWHYLMNSKSLPPPEGMEVARPTQVVTSTEPYQTLRTFLPEVTPRSMAIRGASGVHMAYDLQTCRLAYAWSGDFLDLKPVWNDRGGNRAGIKGPIFWRSPPGFPWDVTNSAGVVPDFSKRGGDTSLGAELPQDGKLYPTRLDFKGYHLDEAGPTFRYQLQLDPPNTRASFTEQVVALHTDGAGGVLRLATVAAPSGQTVWLQVAVSDRPPKCRSADGATSTLDAPEKSAPAEGVLTCVQQGKPLIVHLRAAPAGGHWLVSRVGGSWSVVLRFPATRDVSPARLNLVELVPVNEAQASSVIAAEAQAK